MKINYGLHYIDKKDIRGVTKILKSNFLTQGPTIEKFEKKLKKRFGAKYCIALSSGTAALHLISLVNIIKIIFHFPYSRPILKESWLIRFKIQEMNNKA